MEKISLELTPAQSVIVLIALQDYARFSTDMIVSTVASEMFVSLDMQRCADKEFHAKSMAAAERLLTPLVIKGQNNVKSS